MQVLPVRQCINAMLPPEAAHRASDRQVSWAKRMEDAIDHQARQVMDSRMIRICHLDRNLSA